MITVKELHFPDPPDAPHTEAAQILDLVHGRLRYAQRLLSCGHCRNMIENTLHCAGFTRNGMLDHAGLTLDDIRVMREEAHADAG